MVDLLLLTKDESGNLAAMELSDLSGEEAEQLGPIAGDLLQVLEPDDVEAAASTIPNNSSAGPLLFEHTWAVGLKEAIMNAGGIPLAGGLVAPVVVQMLEAELAEAAAQETTQSKAKVKAAE